MVTMKKSVWVWTFLFLVAVSSHPICLAQVSNEDCLSCHSDKTMEKKRSDGSTQSLFVDEGAFKSSMHREMSCIDCHGDITEIPHPPELKTPDCSGCHADAANQVAKGLHNKIRGLCWPCHGKHDIKSSGDAQSFTNRANQSNLCIKCHQDREDKTFTGYKHSQVVFQGGAEGKVACYQCHVPHLANILEPSQSCNKCHPQILVELQKSVHAQVKGGAQPTCSDCHKEHLRVEETKDEKLTKIESEISECRKCHSEVTEQYFKGLHGKELEKGNFDTPTCISCHGKHGILSSQDPQSPIFHTNIVSMCVKCHEDEKLTEKYGEVMPQPKLIKAYENSVHGKTLAQKELLASPACTDCHGSHEMTPADDPDSPVNKLHIAGTCAKCHPGIDKVYEESVHGKTLSQGILDSPTCTNCHGEHDILAIKDEEGRVSHKNIPKTCSACHAVEALTSKYRLPRIVYQTYKDSFHGIANKFGDLVVADCASCHGFHDIRPSSDTLSSINLKNLVKTCGVCHKGATENFAKGKVHIVATKESSLGVYIVRKFYTWFIGILVTIFVLYVILDLVGRTKRRGRGSRIRT